MFRKIQITALISLLFFLALSSPAFAKDVVIDYSCQENWQCSSWSPSTCSSGTQTRTCTDSNSCGTATSKPSESQSCTVQQSSGGSTGTYKSYLVISGTNSSIEVVKGFTKISCFTVSNKGNIAANNVILTIEGIPGDWYSLSSNFFNLDPGANTESCVYLSAMEDDEKTMSNYKTQFKAADDSGSIAIANVNIKILDSAPAGYNTGEGQNSVLLVEARNAILTTKSEIESAKESGRNTTEAEILLSQSRDLFNNGDYTAAIFMAGYASQSLNPITGQIISEIQSESEFLYFAAIVVGIFAVVILIFIVSKKRSRQNRGGF